MSVSGSFTEAWYSSHLTLRLTWNIKEERKRSAELPVLHDSNTYRCTPLHWAPLTCWCCLCHWWWGSGPSPVCLLWNRKPQNSQLHWHGRFIQYKGESFVTLVYHPQTSSSKFPRSHLYFLYWGAVCTIHKITVNHDKPCYKIKEGNPPPPADTHVLCSCMHLLRHAEGGQHIGPLPHYLLLWLVVSWQEWVRY